MTNTSEEVGGWIRRTQFYWPLVRCSVSDHSGGYWVSQETVKHWAKSSSSPRVVHTRYKGCRCSQTESCASMPHSATGSHFNMTVQIFASFNCGAQSGAITCLYSQEDYQLPSLLPCKWMAFYTCLHCASWWTNKPPACVWAGL